MHQAFLQLLRFTQAMDQPVGLRTAPNLEIDLALRVRLIAEEFGELLGALGVASEREIHAWLAQIERWLAVRRPGSGNLADTLDALCDLTYVVVGSAVPWGLPFPQAWEEVHQVNMTKTTGPVRPDGKRLKPPGFQPPNIERVLQLAAVSTSRLRDAVFEGTDVDRCQIELATRAMLDWDPEFLNQLGEVIDPILDEIPRSTTSCSVCREPQHQTPSGISCPNGHGGTPALEDPTP